MKKVIFLISLLISMASESYAQSAVMKWSCADVEKYQGLLAEWQDNDEKVYANRVMENIQLYTDPASQQKLLLTQALLTVENSEFEAINLLDHIGLWLKRKGWDSKHQSIDLEKKQIISAISAQVATHSTYLDVYKISVTASLSITLKDDHTLSVLLLTQHYNNSKYVGTNVKPIVIQDKIAEVFPFNPKSSYKNSYAKAYVGTYKYFWNFISDLRKELNTNFSVDKVLMKQKQAEAEQAARIAAEVALTAKYGNPTKVIRNPLEKKDVKKEVMFFEESKTVLFMGEPVRFKDIMSVEMSDDPTFIPGKTTSMGLGLSFFGLGLGGSESVRTPDKTIHNYVVNIKIDSLATPLIRVAAGQNEALAMELVSTIEYIIRHKAEY